MVFGDPAELVAYQNLVASFEAEHPEIAISLRHIPSQAEYRRRLATDFSGRAPPDVMLLNYRRFATFAGSGGLEPLERYLEQSAVIDAGDFFSIAIDSFSLDDILWCIPQNVSSLVVYYNISLFDAVGLAYPTDDWTWDHLLVAARALTQDVDGDGQTDQYGVGIVPNLFRLAPFVWQNGGEIVDVTQNPTRLTLDSPASLEALQWFVDLQVKEQVVPDAVSESAESSESRFLNGRLAMLFNSRRGVPTYRTIEGLDWDVAPLPGRKERAGILHSDGYCMAAATADKAAAWAFIEYANSPVGQALVAETGRTVPSLIKVAESSDFTAPLQPPANSAVFVNTIPLLRRVPIMVTWSGIEEVANREIERAFYGQTNAKEAAVTARELTYPFFDSTAED
jgi:multiple sugar transport system substrate-binding protein